MVGFSHCRFPGRRWLRIAQLLPLATPSICSLPHWSDLGSLYTFHIHGMG